MACRIQLVGGQFLGGERWRHLKIDYLTRSPPTAHKAVAAAGGLERAKVINHRKRRPDGRLFLLGRELVGSGRISPLCLQCVCRTDPSSSLVSGSSRVPEFRRPGFYCRRTEVAPHECGAAPIALFLPVGLRISCRNILNSQRVGVIFPCVCATFVHGHNESFLARPVARFAIAFAKVCLACLGFADGATLAGSARRHDKVTIQLSIPPDGIRL